MLQMYVITHDPTTYISTFPDFPNLTPNYTFSLPNLTSTSQPGPWSNNVSVLQHSVRPGLLALGCCVLCFCLYTCSVLPNEASACKCAIERHQEVTWLLFLSGNALQLGSNLLHIPETPSERHLQHFRCIRQWGPGLGRWHPGGQQFRCLAAPVRTS